MTIKNELSNEELEKVTGGEEEETKVSKLTIFFYKPNSIVEEYENVDFEYTGLRTKEQDEADAKKWCEDRNYRYSKFMERTDTRYRF